MLGARPGRDIEEVVLGFRRQQDLRKDENWLSMGSGFLAVSEGYLRISDTATSDTAEATRGRGMGLPRKYLVGAEQAAMAYKAKASACDA